MATKSRCSLCINLLSGVIAIVAVIVGLIHVSIPSGRQSLNTLPQYSPIKSLPPWFIFSPRILLNRLFQAGVRATMDPREHILELVSSFYKSEVVYMLLHHNILDSINGPMTCDDIASTLNLQAYVICEYLKAARQLGLVSVDLERQELYSPTALGALLRRDHKESLRSVGLFLNEETREAWRAASLRSAKTGKSGWEERFNLTYAVWFQNSPDKAKLMREAQVATLNMESGAILADWKPHHLDGVFCDVGGGIGDTVVSVLHHYSNMTGIVVDKPYLSPAAINLIADLKLSKRMSFLGGYFFAPTLPKMLVKCNVFFLKHVLSEFDDENSILILRKVKAVAKTNAKLVIAERVLETNSFEVEKSLSSVGLVASTGYGAKDRSFGQYQELLSVAGYTSRPTLIRLRGRLSIIEVEIGET